MALQNSKYIENRIKSWKLVNINVKCRLMEVN